MNFLVPDTFGVDPEAAPTPAVFVPLFFFFLSPPSDFLSKP